MRGHQKHRERGAAAADAYARTAGPGQQELAATSKPGAVLALQRLIGNARVGDVLDAAERAEQAASQAASVHGVVDSPGKPLGDAVRAEMEPLLGRDLGDVRVHTDQAAHESAESMDADAYTARSHIAFRHNRYDPASEPGRRTLAHELMHVVQQSEGPVAGTDTGAGLALSKRSDPFEREAEHAAPDLAAGIPVARSTTPHAGHSSGLPVARMMSVAEFKRRTSGAWHERRGSKIQPVLQALTAYHRIPTTSYAARRDQLTAIRDAANAYRRTSTTNRHAAAVDALDNEITETLTEVRLPALIEEIMRQAQAHEEIFGLLDTARRETVALTKVRHLLVAQEAVLDEIRATGADEDSDLSLINVKLGEWLNREVFALPADQQAQLVQDDLRRLDAIRADASTAQLTRDLLSDLMAHTGSVTLAAGQPGTSRNADGSGYTVRHAPAQSAGETERLGSLAHELTHVEAGETYRNTDVLLLFPRDLPDQQIKDLADDRRATIDRLTALLNGTTLDADRIELIDSKLKYAMDPRRGVAVYAQRFLAAGKIDESVYARLKAIDDLVSPNSSTLVEYDTVITQILVYLQRWGVDEQDPFHAEVLRVAGGLRTDRAAAAANP